MCRIFKFSPVSWLTTVMICTAGGPEVPTDAALLLTFKCCFIDLFVMLNQKLGIISISEDVLRESEPMAWLTVSLSVTLSQPVRKGAFEHTMFRIAHKNVSWLGHPYPYPVADTVLVPSLSPVQPRL